MTGADGTPPTVASRIDALIAGAQAETGLDDFGGDTWREGLEVLIRSAMAEATFSDMGEMGFYRAVVRSLTNRLKVEDWFRRHPEIDEQTVEIEFLGVGLPRTGSTALSHLLGEDRAFRNLLTWEEATVDRMLAWRADNPRDKHGRHTYEQGRGNPTVTALQALAGALGWSVATTAPTWNR